LSPTVLVALLVVLGVIVVVMVARSEAAEKRPRLPGRVYESSPLFLTQFGGELGLRGEIHWTGVRRHYSFRQQPRLSNFRFHGKLADGREASVIFREILFGTGAATADGEFESDLSVDAPDAPRLSVTRDNWATKLGRWLPGERAPGKLDERLAVDAKSPSAKEALEKTALRRAITETFDHFGVKALAFEHGRVRATVNATVLRHDRYRPLIDLLAAIARSFEGVPLGMGPFGLVRRALKTATGKPRCSYCHADVTGSEPDLVACEKCATVLHDGCFRELRHCPVLGCEGMEAG
jgi:hypothetical protein